MDKVIFILLPLAFLLGFFGRSLFFGILEIFGIKKICCKHNDAISDFCNSDIENFLYKDEKRKKDFFILGKMEYYLASNDEKGMLVCYPTPLQDIGPKNMA